VSTILGIDPGSRVTGYGIVRMEGQRAIHIDNGCVHTADGDLAERLKQIFEAISALLSAHRPDQVAVEKVFMHRNADSALKLGQARGAAIVAASRHALPVFEYSPNQIKQAVVGRGHADKRQVQHMVKVLLCLRELPAQDAADALAAAICHGNTQQGLRGVAAAARARGKRLA
jgi:crossover junction endodeoxyribonuclease RuvC